MSDETISKEAATFLIRKLCSGSHDIMQKHWEAWGTLLNNNDSVRVKTVIASLGTLFHEIQGFICSEIHGVEKVDE